MTFSTGFGSHEDGHVAVCYSQDGKRIISGGTEGDVKIYSGVDSTVSSSYLLDFILVNMGKCRFLKFCSFLKVYLVYMFDLSPDLTPLQCIDHYVNILILQDPEQTFFADAFNVSLIKQWEENIVAASEGWSLQKWGFPEGNKSGFLGKFSGNVTHFSLNFDKDKILVGSAEFIMKITGLILS